MEGVNVGLSPLISQAKYAYATICTKHNKGSKAWLLDRIAGWGENQKVIAATGKGVGARAPQEEVEAFSRLRRADKRDLLRDAVFFGTTPFRTAWSSKLMARATLVSA